MEKTENHLSTILLGRRSARLSQLFHDPYLRQAFRQAEKDFGCASVEIEPTPDPLEGGAAALLDAMEEV